MDLLAYHRILTDARNPVRYQLLAPYRLDDEIAVRLLAKKKLKIRPRRSGARQPSGMTKQQVAWASRKMLKAGQNPRAVEFFMKRALQARVAAGKKTDA